MPWNWNEKPNGEPRIGRTKNGVIEVKSATTKGLTYLVDLTAGWPFGCVVQSTGESCPDHLYRTRTCKHMKLAYEFSKLAFKPKEAA